MSPRFEIRITSVGKNEDTKIPRSFILNLFCGLFFIRLLYEGPSKSFHARRKKIHRKFFDYKIKRKEKMKNPRTYFYMEDFLVDFAPIRSPI